MAKAGKNQTMKICTVKNCSGRVESRGYCRSHWKKWWRYGDPLAGKTQKGAPKKFILDVALVYDSDECLIWPFSRCGKGYPFVSFDGRQTTASRVVCELTHGKPPTEKHQAAHSCGNGRGGCVNPRHVRWATVAENHADKHAHGTAQIGENHGCAKLSEGDVREIRVSRGLKSGTELAKKFGVTKSNISAIQKRRAWSHVQ